MIDPHCRIGKITSKVGGATVEVINPGDGRDARAIRKSLVSSSERVALEYPDMIGFALVTWDKEGTPTSVANIGNGSPVGASLMPSFVAEVLGRRVR